MKICRNLTLQVHTQDLDPVLVQSLFPVLAVRTGEQMKYNLLCAIQPAACPPVPGHTMAIKALAFLKLRHVGDDAHQDLLRQRGEQCLQLNRQSHLQGVRHFRQCTTVGVFHQSLDQQRLLEEVGLSTFQLIDHLLTTLSVHHRAAMLNHHLELLALVVTKAALRSLPIELVAELRNASKGDNP